MQKLVFIVDDNDANLTMAASALEKEFQVLTMPSAAKMFSLLEKKRPDMILLDIEMPEIGGFDAIETLKARPDWCNIPVVFLTGWSDESILSRALKSGALEVLNKPFIPSMLLNCVKRLIKADDSYSVLIVDDQETSLTALSNILSPDYTVYEADNGPEAIEIAEKYLPDVILLDVLMTQMDGYAVIEKLKASEETQSIPIIFITSLGTSKDEEKGLALGAVDYITKPFVPEIVRLRLQNQIKVLEQVRTIERLSTIDQLTDLPNRRSFETRMGTEWGRATREKTPISILMIDIDLFKHYNDTYGHQQGDAALQDAAKVFSQKLKRHGDFAARWGGEEFIILLPNTDEEGAIDVAEQVRQAVERLEIPGLNGMITKINVSIGIYTRLPNQGRSSISEFISRADKALYNAKNNGRNQAQVYKEN